MALWYNPAARAVLARDLPDLSAEQPAMRSALSNILAIPILVFAINAPPPAAAAPPDQPAKPAPANRLAKETSPYLLLHAHNPVDWYPWGPEAFAKAKAEGKPIFLSIGYSACYWCHVMERESFSNPAIAKILNEHFVCVKVDKEERPDVDQIYMTALLALGQGGGWPMSMFLLGDGRPFFGGSYFPPADRDGHEGFPSLLKRVIEAWRDHRPEIQADAERLSSVTRRLLARAAAKSKTPLTRAMGDAGQTELAEQFDPEYGGFGYDAPNPHKPKFPEPSNLVFLLARHARAQARGERGNLGLPETASTLEMVTRTLDHMARGGIRDQLAGGYHRYSTERTWTVPHFEKMLYDNAQLASVFVCAYEATHEPRFRAEAESIFAFVARSLTAPAGAFYSSLDAEVAGEEGKYYVWTRDEVKRVLPAQADFDLFARVYGLDRPPNFEGERYVLFQPLVRAEQAQAVGITQQQLEDRLAPLRAKLLAARDKRPAPSRDDKVLTAWNGLMIAAYADAFRVLKDAGYRQAAEKAADFLWAHLRAADGRLLRTYRAGQAKLPGYLEDYACFAYGLLRLHAATGQAKRLEQAHVLADRMSADFADPHDGAFFFTANDHESLFSRPKDAYDAALPSGNSVAVRVLLALSAATGQARYRDQARQTLETFSSALGTTPASMPLMLVGLEEFFDAVGERPPVLGRGLPRAQPPAPDALAAQVVTASARIEPGARATPGAEFTAQLSISIREGWHLYAHEPGSEFVKPTQVELEPAAGVVLVRVEYPRGDVQAADASGSERVAVYEKAAAIKLVLRLAKSAAAGPAKIPLKLRYQACNDRSCLAPASLAVPLSITIEKP